MDAAIAVGERCSRWCGPTPPDSLLRTALDGAGITSAPVDRVAPYLSRGELVRVLSPWTIGRPTMYAALPSRKFPPQRPRVFPDDLVEQTRQLSASTLGAGAAAVPG